jgi:hypothetical protein
LDELTDEEQEDLRAQLNKNKEPVVRFLSHFCEASKSPQQQ